MADSTDVLDASEAADYLKINVQTVRRFARDREVPAFRVGGAWRFRRSWLDRWAEAQHDTTPRNVHVVAVDDEEAVLGFVQRTLTDHNCTVSVATNGPDALELMDRRVPDLAILDLLMPGMDGPTLLGHIRERYGAVPVIILTAYPESEAMERAMEHSPITLLAKPPRLEQFLDAVNAALGRIGAVSRAAG